LRREREEMNCKKKRDREVKEGETRKKLEKRAMKECLHVTESCLSILYKVKFDFTVAHPEIRCQNCGRSFSTEGRIDVLSEFRYF